MFFEGQCTYLQTDKECIPFIDLHIKEAFQSVDDERYKKFPAYVLVSLNCQYLIQVEKKDYQPNRIINAIKNFCSEKYQIMVRDISGLSVNRAGKLLIEATDSLLAEPSSLSPHSHVINIPYDGAYLGTGMCTPIFEEQRNLYIREAFRYYQDYQLAVQNYNQVFLPQMQRTYFAGIVFMKRCWQW